MNTVLDIDKSIGTTEQRTERMFEPGELYVQHDGRTWRMVSIV